MFASIRRILIIIGQSVQESHGNGGEPPVSFVEILQSSTEFLIK